MILIYYLTNYEITTNDKNKEYPFKEVLIQVRRFCLKEGDTFSYRGKLSKRFIHSNAFRKYPGKLSKIFQVFRT